MDIAAFWSAQGKGDWQDWNDLFYRVAPALIKSNVYLMAEFQIGLLPLE